MAEPVDGSNLFKHGRPVKYPWDEWFDGQSWKLTQGEDFHCTVDGMDSTIRAHAKRHGFEVRVKRSGKNVWLQVNLRSSRAPHVSNVHHITSRPASREG
jgi:hypothetical protein